MNGSSSNGGEEGKNRKGMEENLLNWKCILDFRRYLLFMLMRHSIPEIKFQYSHHAKFNIQCEFFNILWASPTTSKSSSVDHNLVGTNIFFLVTNCVTHSLVIQR